MARPLSSAELADNICTNPARIRKVMSRLRQAGLIETREGRAGGYAVKDDIRKTDIKCIALSLEQPMFELSWHSGDMDKECLVSSGMGSVMDEIADGLNEACLKELSAITISDVEEKLFGKKNKEKSYEKV